MVVRENRSQRTGSVSNLLSVRVRYYRGPGSRVIRPQALAKSTLFPASFAPCFFCWLLSKPGARPETRGEVAEQQEQGGQLQRRPAAKPERAQALGRARQRRAQRHGQQSCGSGGGRTSSSSSRANTSGRSSNSTTSADSSRRGSDGGRGCPGRRGAGGGSSTDCAGGRDRGGGDDGRCSARRDPARRCFGGCRSTGAPGNGIV